MKNCMSFARYHVHDMQPGGLQLNAMRRKVIFETLEVSVNLKHQVQHMQPCESIPPNQHYCGTRVLA